MEIGIGLDQGLGLSFPEYRELIREAVGLGYESAWTPAGLNADAFQICGQWSAAATDAGNAAFGTGISVLPVPFWSAPALAATAATTGLLTGGRFILGIGTGGIYSAEWRHTHGVPDVPAVAMMRDYLVTLRRLIAGESVTHEGKAVRLHGAQIGVKGPPVPLYLGALGPQMLRLAGEAADGAALNWCTPEQVAWSRGRIAEGARRAGREPSAVRVAEYIRICVDEDEDAARRGLARALMGYALARPGASKEAGYRGHFARMGFDAPLSELEQRRERGAPDGDLIEDFPRDLLRAVGYYGPAAGANDAFLRLAQGLDTAIVRVVPARRGLDAIRAVMRACAPAAVRA
jgi:alkanesulfonate monooxygenase SsuD/methylene tetrahydromethanopterin reductase-like flavin-dependent oxidoreductase (luciferase family)